MAMPAAAISTAKPSSSASPEKSAAARPPAKPPSATLGKSHAAARQSTLLARACEITATPAVVPTTASESAIAVFGSTPSASKSGTVSVEPPPPSKPSASPIARPPSAAQSESTLAV